MASPGNQHSVSCIGTFSFRISRRSKILDWSAHPLLMGQTVTFYGPGFTARRYASAVYAVVVCASVRQLQVGIVSKRLDESSRVFWHGGFLLPIPPCAVRKFGYLQKLGYTSLRMALCPKLRT